MPRTCCVLLTVLLAVAVLAVVSPVGATPAAGPAPDALATVQPPVPDRHASPAATVQSEDDIVARYEYRLLPEDPDHVEATVTFQYPGDVDVWGVDPPSDVTVVDVHGFDEDADDGYVWDGHTDDPSVTVREPLSDAPEPPGRHTFGTGEWAVVEPPWMVGLLDVEFDGEWRREFAVDGAGVAGEDLVFLGPHETYGADGDHERIVLVVPEAADLPAPPEEVVRLLEHASDRLETGHRPAEAYHAFVVPQSVDFAGTSTVGDDALYFERLRLDTADGAWVEQYVHTRVSHGPLTRETDWLALASANYYASLLAVELGHVSFEEFRAELRRGSDPEYDDVVLSDPSTPGGYSVHSTHGAAVVAAIDREIREGSDGDASFQGVIRAANEAETFDQEAFLDAVEAEGGPEARDLARELTETTTLPETWDGETHVEVFDVEVPLLDASLANDGRLWIEGPYREGPVTGPVLPGERVVAEVAVSNEGTATGTYEAALVREPAVEDAVLDDASVRVEPGQRRTLELRTRPREPGRHNLGVPGGLVVLNVVEPATPNVTALEVSPEDPRPGDTVTVTATLETDESLALGELVVAGNGTRANATAVVAADETRNVSVTLDEVPAGTLTASVGDRTRPVDVADPSGLAALPGFGLVAAVAALAAAVAALARREPPERAA